MGMGLRMAIVTGSLGDGSILLCLHLVFTIFCIIPLRSNMPMLGGDARVVLDACRQLELPLPASGIQWGAERKRIAGFAVHADEVLKGWAYPSFRELRDRPSTREISSITPRELTGFGG